MAQAVLSLLRDDNAYQACSRAARHTAETSFATTRIIPQYEAYYRELCES
jgi:hypothetical protein